MVKTLRTILLTACLLVASYMTGATQTSLVPTTTLTLEKANNTSAANSFTGTTSGDIAAGNVSKMPIRSLMYAGATAKVYANWVPWFGASNHINIGYNSTDPVEIQHQVNDMISRGVDGLIVDWYSTGNIDKATVAMRHEIELHPNFVFALMPDSGAYHGLTDPTQKLINDVNYAAGSYFLSPNYMRINGHPVLFPFGLEQYPIDWARAQANIKGSPIFIFRNASGFTHQASSGSFAWGPDSAGLSYFDSFYTTALKTTKFPFGAVSKGFNDALAAWGQHRFLDQQCGQRWLSTFAEVNKYYSASTQLPYLQLVTWNDYEEGTEMESGIDNCVTITAQTLGPVLTWTVTGQENTIDHYSVFISTDGENLMDLADLPSGTHSLDLSQYQLAAANYTLYVKAVGVASVRNQMSGAATYTPTLQPPTALIAVSQADQQSFTITATTDGSSSPNGTIVSSSIDFGDGTVVSGATATHTYNAPGNYTITGTVTDNFGVTDSATTGISLKELGSVTITSPIGGSTANGIVNITASSASNLPISSMVVYVDNQKKFTSLSNQLSMSLALPAGNHQLIVKALDSLGTVFQSSLDFKVSGVLITNPSSSTSTTSLNIVASATPKNPAHPITAMIIYIDNSRKYTVYTDHLNTTLKVTAAKHTVVVKAWDNTGTIYSSTVTVTAK